MSEEKAIPECIDRWRRQLLDLTGRNRMLYYRTSRATLTVYCSEASVWQKLVEDGEIELDQKVLVPTSVPEGNAERHFEEARKRVKRLYDLARTFLDEQGVHVIYAVFGWLNWTDESRPPLPGEDTVELKSGRKARKVRSPLLFVPITLDITATVMRAKYEENAVVETNLALQSFLDQQFGMTVALDPDTELAPEIVIDAWRHVVGRREHWSVEQEPTVLIDSFSFRKIALLRELEKSIDRIIEQPVLRAFCGDAQQLLEAPAVPSYDDLDHALSTEKLNLVVPADASQTKALLAVQRGVNLVIQGPPGTGKSQTITNIISTMVAQGKRVLFIAEKRPAREIVVENLSKAGLGDAVLHITEEVLGQRGSSQAKRDIVDQLADILEQGAGQYFIERDYQSDYERVRSQLNHYATTLHTPVGPSPSSTPFQLMTAWSRQNQEMAKELKTKLPSIREVDEIWKEKAFEFANKIDDLGEDVLNCATEPWLDVQVLKWSSPFEAEIATQLKILCDAPQTIAELLQIHWKSYNLVDKQTLDALDDIAEFLASVGKHHTSKQRPLGVLTPTFWRTRKASLSFRLEEGIRADLALTTSTKLKDYLSTLRSAQASVAQLFPRYGKIVSISELALFGQRLLESINTAAACVQVRERCAEASELGLDEVLLELVRARSSGESLKEMLEATLAKSWAYEAYNCDTCFSTEGAALNRQVDRLEHYERQATQNAKTAVLNAIAPYRPSYLNVAPRDSELGILRAQIHAKRRKPLRWLFTKSANSILQMKPCIVASPLAVAQFLHSEAYVFDLVVFDEASQIPTADAVIPISRAKQVVVVGDSQQMPPTSFFERAVTLETDNPDEVVFESVLQDSEALLPALSLTWHYRSQDERLIAFSNYSFYGGKLLTFPSAWLEHPKLGIKFIHLPTAVYGRGGSRANPEEANRVIEILEEELMADSSQEIGVIAMSIAQAVEIEARLEERAQASAIIREWLEHGGRARHLETVQGDEFDVSILSFGYGRDAAGNLQLNFGPLSREDGYKRLNVCVTRAKKRMIVVSSIRGADIPIGRVSEGGQRIRQFLEYAEHGPSVLSAIVGATSDVLGISESPFEEQVANEIRALGWSVDTQVGVHKFRVDIGIRHPQNPGVYLAGVECDGATYHSGETARDRDIGRQQILEKLGWKIFRIWSPDWFRAKDKVLRELHAFLSSLLEDDQGDNGNGSAPDPKPSNPTATQGLEPTFKRFEPGLKAGTVPYRLEGPENPPTDQKDVKAWARWLAEKVRIEGPWEKREIDAVIQAHSIDWQVRYSMVNQAINQGLLKLRDSTYWHAQTTSRLVPVKVSNSKHQRNFGFYSDEELLRALELSCADVGSIPKSELAWFTTRFLGLSRTTKTIRSRIESLIPQAIKENYIKEDGENYRAGVYWRHYHTPPLQAPYVVGIQKVPAITAQIQKERSISDTSPRLSMRQLIITAYSERRALKIRYRNASGFVTERVIEVLGVGANYIDAFDHLRNEPRTFRIDRMIKAELTSDRYHPSRGYSPSQWVTARR